MLSRALGLVLLLNAAVPAHVCAQDMIGFPREDFGKIVLSQRQMAGGVPEVAIGAYSNEPISSYGQGSYLYQLGRPVGRLDVLTNLRVFPCTAFLVSSKYLITNYHCVPGVIELPEAQIIGVKRIEAVQLKLGYTRQGVEEGARSFTVSPVPVEADKGLDYAILEVFGEPAPEFGLTRLTALEPQGKMPLIIIGHPQGWAQHVSLLHCRSDDPAVSAGQLRHTCDTLPGNSGSPVFDADSRAVIALHHAGSAAQSINYAVPLTKIVANSKVLQQILRGQQGVTAPKRPEPNVAIAAPPPAPPPTPAPERCAGVEVTVGQAERRCFEPGAGKTEQFKDCPTCPEMVVVPVGSFIMGSPPNEPLYDPGHSEAQVRVSIGAPFAVGKFAVTFDEWDVCVADGGCNGYKPSDEGWGRGRRPVINVSWDDAKSFTAWLSRKTGKSYRLLSEAEREYVTRAGTTTPFWWGSSITPSQANYDGRPGRVLPGNVLPIRRNPYEGDGSKGENRQSTVPVDSFEANPWGLYNVHGNVWEWTEDCWNESNTGIPGNGSARTAGDCKFRVVRGGSWSIPRYLRAAYRYRFLSGVRGNGQGLRLARTLNP